MQYEFFYLVAESHLHDLIFQLDQAFGCYPEREGKGEYTIMSLLKQQTNILSLFAVVVVFSTSRLVVSAKCSVCGEGKRVGNENAVYVFPGQPGISCIDLQEAGEDGGIPIDQCLFLPNFIEEVCECESMIIGSSNGVASGFKEKCSVCGEGKKVGKDDGIFVFPDQPAISCMDLQKSGEDGRIPLGQCAFLPTLVGVCECEPIVITSIIESSSGLSPSLSPLPTDVVVDNDIIDDLSFTVDNSDDKGDDNNTVFPIPALSQIFSCSVCGISKKVGNLNAVVEFSGEPAVSCSDLQIAGERGLVPMNRCQFLPTLIEGICECVRYNKEYIPFDELGEDISSYVLPLFDDILSLKPLYKEEEGNVFFTTVTLTESPSSNAVVPANNNNNNNDTSDLLSTTGDVSCSVCGKGRKVGDENTMFAFPGQPAVTCKELQIAGEEGSIPLDQCAFYPRVILQVCGCMSVINNEASDDDDTSTNNNTNTIPQLDTLPNNSNSSSSSSNNSNKNLAPVITSVKSSSPITSSPLTTAPIFVTINPVLTSAPVTSAPITLVPITPAPIITAAPVTAILATPTPTTPAPITPVQSIGRDPVTPAPVTPAPIILAPPTLNTITAAPVTPIPTTLAPITLVQSIGRDPITPDPVTPAPIILAQPTLNTIEITPPKLNLIPTISDDNKDYGCEEVVVGGKKGNKKKESPKREGEKGIKKCGKKRKSDGKKYGYVTTKKRGESKKDG